MKVRELDGGRGKPRVIAQRSLQCNERLKPAAPCMICRNFNVAFKTFTTSKNNLVWRETRLAACGTSNLQLLLRCLVCFKLTRACKKRTKNEGTNIWTTKSGP